MAESEHAITFRARISTTGGANGDAIIGQVIEVSAVVRFVGDGGSLYDFVKEFRRVAKKISVAEYSDCFQRLTEDARGLYIIRPPPKAEDESEREHVVGPFKKCDSEKPNTMIVAT